MNDKKNHHIIKTYAGLAKKILKDYRTECERWGNLIVKVYNDKLHAGNGRGKNAGDEVFLLFLREWIELLQGVEILYSKTLTKPAQVLVRSLFEIYLQLNYLTIDLNEMEKKGLCYQLYCLWKEIRNYNQKIKYANEFNLDNIMELENKVSVFNDLYEKTSLNSSYSPIKLAHEELTKNKTWWTGTWYNIYEYMNNNRKQYTLFTMANEVNDAVKQLYCQDENFITFQYSVLYDYLSQTAHGTNLIDRIKCDGDCEFLVSVGCPENSYFGVLFIRDMFSQLKNVVTRTYFFGQKDAWNSNELIECNKLIERQNKRMEKLKSINDKLEIF